MSNGPAQDKSPRFDADNPAALEIGWAAFDRAAASVNAGETIVYTLTLANAGNQNASGVTLTDSVPPHTTFDPAEVMARGNWTYGHTPTNEGGELIDTPDGYDNGAFAPAGYAFSKPATSNDTPEGRSQNRRVELKPIW